VALLRKQGLSGCRKVINKHLTRTDRRRGACHRGCRRLQREALLLIGLPTETQEDVSGVLDLVKTIKHHLVKQAATRAGSGNQS